MVLLSYPVVSLLLARGAFGREAVDGTAVALAVYSIALVALCIRHLVTFAFFALQQTRTMLVVTGGMTILNVVLDIVLFDALSYPGLALGMALTTWVHAGILLFLLHRHVGGVAASRLGLLLLKSGIAAGVMALVIGYGVSPLSATAPGTSWGWRALWIIALCWASAGIYLTIVWLCRVEELEHLLALLRRKRYAKP
jgi:putative peptidoglycan lipid II flippase